MQSAEPRRSLRQDTMDLHDINHHQQHSGNGYGGSDEDHSVLEDDSDGEERDGEYMDEDDASSSLSIPNESIDFDLVYSLHTFVATVEGQANVVKGDSLVLMDDSNSYWWLVRVLKTQEVGYIPAENIETPFERLARLNKHRNVDLASATPEEVQEDIKASRERMRAGLRTGGSSSPATGGTRSVVFSTSKSDVFNYPPAVWNEEESGEFSGSEGSYEEVMDEDHEEAPAGMEEPDDGMSWVDSAGEEQQARTVAAPVTSRPGLAQSTAPLQTQHQPIAQPQIVQTQSQAQLGIGQSPALRAQSSRERLTAAGAAQLDQPSPPHTPNTPSSRGFDPDQITETRRLTATPSIARDEAKPMQQGGPLLPSAILQQQQEEAKRAREEEEEARKRNGRPKEQALQRPSDRKLKKEPSKDTVLEDEKDKKKKGLLGGLFGRKSKEKSKDKRSGNESDGNATRASEDSTRSGTSQYTNSPPEPRTSTSSAPVSTPQTLKPTEQNKNTSARNSTNPRQSHLLQPAPAVSPHSLKMQQQDLQQQALYQQQYLNRSPGSQPDPVQPSYGLQSASAFLPSPSTNASLQIKPATHPRPGSLILTPTGDGHGVPDLSVMRVFAGDNLQSEATFKTVLLNASTTSSDLIKQAMQRFRLAAGEDETDYYLTVKQLGGASATLHATEKPLVVFEELVEAAQTGFEAPKVKRSSVGSISSVMSNLSMHPAIKKLGMNDFTDDSAVKFYLNRRIADELGPPRADETTTRGQGVEQNDTLLSVPSGTNRLNVLNTGGLSNVTQERFSSPTARFPLQLIIFPEDLPDGMVFDPHTEAIVPRVTLRDRSQSNAAASPSISQTQRRKVFMFPKNTTVAEVIELGLERFGIVEGVVDGGDEVEDKLSKRRSISRVRYGLAVEIDGQERELHPSSKVLEAYPRPPSFRLVEQRRPSDRRRSADVSQLLGQTDDVQPDDPVFILRRAVGYRSTSSTRSRLSASLDEVALQHLHRESASESSLAGAPEDTKPQAPPQLSKAEFIAAQRAMFKANQRAILSAQANSEQGVDVVLSDKATIRSQRVAQDDRIRYSYIQPDGETYDISEIIEDEWQDDQSPLRKYEVGKGDVLEGALGQPRDNLGERLGRVIEKIKGGTKLQAPANPASRSNSASPSGRSSDTNTGRPPSRSDRETESRAALRSAGGSATGSRSNTPLTSRDPPRTAIVANHKKQQPSIASVMSDTSAYDPSGSSSSLTLKGSTDTNITPVTVANTPTPMRINGRGPIVLKDDFGVDRMMAVIELTASATQVSHRSASLPLSTVDQMFFGPPINMEELHPQVRELFEGTFKQLDDMDHQLDQMLMATMKPMTLRPGRT